MTRIIGTDAYPLQWPAGWPRTKSAHIIEGKYQFRRPGRSNPFWTFAAARDALIDEVRRLGATAFVLSSNFKVDRNEIAIEPSRRPQDQGVAMYFVLNGRQRVMARDKFTRFEENCRSLTLAIEAMRALERHGGGTMMERAFSGFDALPPPDATPVRPTRTCWRVLGVAPSATDAEIDAAYRRLAKDLHPDAGGTAEDMAELNAARARAKNREAV